MSKQETEQEKRERQSCRICEGGDGICSRHAHKFRVTIKQMDVRYKAQQRRIEGTR